VSTAASPLTPSSSNEFGLRDLGLKKENVLGADMLIIIGSLLSVLSMVESVAFMLMLGNHRMVFPSTKLPTSHELDNKTPL
jgi:hypothetical protein